MDKIHQTTPRKETQEDIIVLGVASADTHGGGFVGEGTGEPILPGISKE